MNVAYIFVYRFHIIHKNFFGDWTNNCTFLASIFFINGILKVVEKIEKIHMDFEKSINSFEMKRRIGYLIIYWKILLFIYF